MPDALEEHGGKVSIGGREMSNSSFSLAEEEQELVLSPDRKSQQNLRFVKAILVI